jgi:hypothetical protein
MKQETLEEVAERLFKEFQLENPIVPNSDIRPFKLGFVKSFKYQQQRMYSEEEVLKILESHKDVLEFDKDRFNHDEWFEQFKKK